MTTYHIPVFLDLASPGGGPAFGVTETEIAGIGQLMDAGWLAEEIAQEYDYLSEQQRNTAMRIWRQRMK